MYLGCHSFDHMQQEHCQGSRCPTLEEINAAVETLKNCINMKIPDQDTTEMFDHVSKYSWHIWSDRDREQLIDDHCPADMTDICEEIKVN